MNAARPIIEWVVDARYYALKTQDIAYDATHGNLSTSSLAIRYCLVAIGEALDWVPEEFWQMSLKSRGERSLPCVIGSFTVFGLLTRTSSAKSYEMRWKLSLRRSII
jgi:hypothetical protein